MCLKVTYTLICEHVKTQMIYCANATYASGPSASGSGGYDSSSKTHKGKGKGKASSSSSRTSPSSSSRIPCTNLTQQSLPYPTPPSFEDNPQTAAASLLSPNCPLPNCPFEAKNRCWDCCWCGKGWNTKGRCSCILLIDGNQVQCAHICCPQCQAAAFQ
ncbi:hypothetical protein CMQ_7649 [Grosmannia clavigera kw1407]|uniref:Uncharacterized protein n=1 Tax=Grosmannia clavigera (strain kw1407 / UAMH 11150) TaxID=655863 RepID=F0XP37_GROCL|nr:uncharacterized protein CMQ_7649 [Grosmannia clavigera kw1407]EFX00647.1 hypothetical protein CMQ_7649 [Grosmannia clavigera kw1407]